MTSATNAWLATANSVMQYGKAAYPRQQTTKENINQVTSFDMNYPVVFHEDRHLSYTFMAAEALWITSGSPFCEDIVKYCSHVQKYSDDGYIFNGAYGPAFISQINFVVDSLRKDIYTRQAVMTIWHPNPIETKDHKCTIAFIFFVRKRRLNVTVQMRSSDIWLGLPYDMFNFTIMTLKILTTINERILSVDKISLGEMTINAVSSHIYNKNVHDMGKLLANDNTNVPETIPSECYTEWKFVVKSLLACRSNVDTTLWTIRP